MSSEFLQILKIGQTAITFELVNLGLTEVPPLRIGTSYRRTGREDAQSGVNTKNSRRLLTNPKNLWKFKWSYFWIYLLIQLLFRSGKYVYFLLEITLHLRSYTQLNRCATLNVLLHKESAWINMDMENSGYVQLYAT